MKSAVKNFFSMGLAVILFFGIILIAGSTEVNAAAKPLEKGQYFRLGTCTIPGRGYGPNGGYEMNEKQDSFNYNGEYFYATGDSSYPLRFSETEYPEVYRAPVCFAYANRYKEYDATMRFDYNLPNGYHATSMASGIRINEKEYYIYTIPGSISYPLYFSFSSEEKGAPWGIQVVSGDGTQASPFRFGLLFSEPYSLEINSGEHGTASVPKPNAEAGERIKLDIKADNGYEIDVVMMRKDDGILPSLLPIRPDEKGEYSFTMPAAEVSIGVNFKRKAGLASITNSDGTETLYDTLAAALPDWKNNTTLTLLEGTTLDEPVTVTDNRTLDLNGYVLKAEEKAFTVNSGGSLTIMDSEASRETTFEGNSYKGGYIIGAVNGREGNYGDELIKGVIDVSNGSVVMNGGSLINSYGDKYNTKWGLSAAAGAKIRINEGYIKATRSVIVGSAQNVSVELAGGRYDLEAYWPVAANEEYYSAISVTGGYYKKEIYDYPNVAEGYKEERKKGQKDWKYSDYGYRVVDAHEAHDVNISGKIENGSVTASAAAVMAGETVTLTATPDACYMLKNYVVNDSAGAEIEVSNGSFTMPNSAVTVSAVFEGIPVTKIRLNKLRMTLDEDGSETLNPALYPADALNRSVSWESADTSVATVNQNGLVKAVGIGKTSVTATAVESGLSVTCTVTVQHTHKLTKVEATEANCVTEGNIEYWVCNKGDHACGRYFTDEKGENEVALSDTVIPADGERHGQIKGFTTTTETVSKRTCTTPLSQNTITKCNDCGEIVSFVHHGEAAYGHNWGEWTVKKVPTETTEGLEVHTCTRCKATETRVIPAVGHQHGQTKVEAKAATCTEPGNKEYWVCSGGDHPCGRCFSDETVAAEIDPVLYPTGHSADKIVRESETPATCETPASYVEVVYCSKCNAELSRTTKTEGSALGHDWSDWQEADEFTHSRVCRRDSSHTDTALHRWDAGHIETSGEHAGEMVYTCLDCGCMTTRITKMENPLKVSGKTVKVRYNRLKKTKQTLAVSKVIRFKAKTDDRKVYKISSAKKGKKSFKKYFRINKNTGRVTVKKGLKKGTYKVKVRVRALGNVSYKASAWKTATVKVKVK